MLFASTLDRELREYGSDRYASIEQADIEKLLYPLLRAEDRPTAREMLTVVAPLLSEVLDTERETPYLAAIAAGKYQPDLLFPDQPEITQRVAKHPALLWKAANVAAHLSRQGGPVRHKAPN